MLALDHANDFLRHLDLVLLEEWRGGKRREFGGGGAGCEQLVHQINRGGLRFELEHRQRGGSLRNRGFEFERASAGGLPGRHHGGQSDENNQATAVRDLWVFHDVSLGWMTPWRRIRRSAGDRDRPAGSGG